MKAPSNSWEADYSASRRKHHHRCIVCRRILQAGERVFMCRMDQRVTKVAHFDCANSIHSPPSPFTVREIMEVWGNAYARKCGWRDIPYHPAELCS